MIRTLTTLTIVCAALLAAVPAQARHRGHHAQHHHAQHHHAHFGTPPAAGGGRIWVDTAAGIKIEVAPDFAPKIQGFIADMVARGIHPTRITCFSLAHSHRSNSNHKRARACDFNRSANNFSPMNGHRVSPLADKWNLRDGCDFGDCGHIDDASNVGGIERWRAATAHRHGSHRYAYRHHRRFAHRHHHTRLVSSR